MQLFLDTADLPAIEALLPTGMIDGVTTNPTLIFESGAALLPTLASICAIVPGPVSAEVVADDYEGMLREAEVLRQVASNIVIKLPLTEDGLRACRTLVANNVKTNVTLCFSAAQTLLAMKAGATYLSPFLGRFAAQGGDAAQLLTDIIAIKRQYGFHTKILAASIRDTAALELAARLGADCATLGPKVLNEAFGHEMTKAGLRSFSEAWTKTGQTIC